MGAVLAIVASLLWVATGSVIPVVMKNLPAVPDVPAAMPQAAAAVPAAMPQAAAPVNEQPLPQPPEDITVERTENPDGTVTVVTKKTVVKPDGSKVVTESTMVEPASV